MPSQASLVHRPLERGKFCRVAPTQANTREEEEEEFITSGTWRGKGRIGEEFIQIQEEEEEEETQFSPVLLGRRRGGGGTVSGGEQ